jgi:hypothetical protein
MKKNIFILCAIIFAFAGCGDENTSPSGGEGTLADIAAELGKDADYSLFAAALANADVANEADGYTIFALPDSIIELDGEEISVEEALWHVVKGKYTSVEALLATPLQTIGGQTLTVETENIEIDGTATTVLYVNDIPVDYDSRRLLGETPMYSIGTNIAKASATPDNLDAYNNQAARKMAGKWKIVSVTNNIYHIWSDGTRDPEPYSNETDKNFHANCCEIFHRDPDFASKGYAGTYESVHPCGSVIHYAGSAPGQTKHQATGVWSAEATASSFSIRFAYNAGSVANPQYRKNDGLTNPNTALSSTITVNNGRGDSGYYGGDELVIIGDYYETVYVLKKVFY